MNVICVALFSSEPGTTKGKFMTRSLSLRSFAAGECLLSVDVLFPRISFSIFGEFFISNGRRLLSIEVTNCYGFRYQCKVGVKSAHKKAYRRMMMALRTPKIEEI
jgi:hypothetical protein